MEIFFAVAIGFVLDLIFGDPPWLPHPIRLIGWMISTGEKLARRLFPKTSRGEFLAGLITSLCVISLSFAVPLLILWLASMVGVYFKVAVESLFCYQILATKCLKVESMRVYHYLEKNDLPNSRKYLSWIVGRDTANLNPVQITKAAVETVAENTSDGVIAPLIFMVIGGAPLAFLYKAVNTLDSMIGYKNDKYMYFGQFAAKLDDLLNFLPAIISAYAMIAASFLLRLNFKNAAKIYKRDCHNHSSPNSAKTESVCAGALDIQLAGDSYYFGKLVKKQTIGDANRAVVIGDIPLSNKLMYATAFLSVAVFLTIRVVVVILL